MSSTPPPEPTPEPTPEPIPTSESINRQAAVDSFSDGEEVVECPTCHNPRRQFLIDDTGKCDSCRTRDQQAIHPATQLGWPEIRQRRRIIFKDSDETQIPDYPEAKRLAVLPLRQALRNVTQQPDPMAAWRKLDEIERDINIAR